MTINRILVLIAVICFVLAAFGVPTLGGLVGLVALGLAFYAASSLV